MKILSISLDKNIFKSGSDNEQRQIDYGSLFTEYHIIVLTPRGFSPKKLSENTWVYPTNSLTKPFYFLDAFKKGVEIIKSKRIDRITTQDPFETALIGYWLKIKFKLPLLIQEHADVFGNPFWKWEGIMNFIRNYLGRAMFKKADAIRIVTERTRAVLDELGIPREKIYYGPWYVNVKMYKNSVAKLDLHKKYSNREPIILSMARFVKQKNFPLLIDAFSDVVKNHPKALLLLVGRGPEEKRTRRKIENNGLENNVVIESWTDDQVSYYKTADLFVMSSNYEGWGRTIVEAMASGCPVVMTDVGCAGAVVKDGNNGVVVPLNDRNTLMDAMIKIIEDVDFRNKIITNALDTVERLPDWSNHLRRYKEFIETK